MNKILKKSFIGLIVCTGILYLQVSQGFADSGIAIVNHATAYSITRKGENYYIKGPVINVASKKISGKIQILDVIRFKPNTLHKVGVFMVDPESNTPVSTMLYGPSKSDTGIINYLTEINISNKPAGDYFILVTEGQEGEIGRFMLRIE